jgi:ribosome biogenesis protein ERB1
MKIVRGIRSGAIVLGRPKRSQQQKDTLLRPNHNLWDDQKDRERDPHPMHLPPPKFRLPDNSESINPPAEYLLTPEERAEWEAMDPEDRRRNYLPQKYPNLRSGPGYKRFINERFSRCLDLYLCPRTWKRRPVDPNSLMPDLPDPKELEPFPKRLAIVYRGHEGNIRSFSIDPTGQWLVSGGDDKTARLWEVASGRCLRVWPMPDVVMSVEWNPNKQIRAFACVA